MIDSEGKIFVCLDCRRTTPAPAGPCVACGGRRIESAPELFELAIAHVDCDAFYAAVEKRDNPALEDLPVIVGGGQRGVVTTACYVARTFGVRSAMPMFKALAACPHAVVIRPNFEKYAEASGAVKDILLHATPLVEPVSIDEAFLDLSGTERVHGMPPASVLARLQREVKSTVGVTISVGLSGNKFLAKLASDLDKPDGFAVIPMSEAPARLASLPIARVWGVGAATEQKLASIGIRTIGDAQRADPDGLVRRFGAYGRRLYDLAWGRDARKVSPERDTKSVSAETTFRTDISALADLQARLRELCDDVSRRMKAKGLEGAVVVVKLKNAAFEIRSKRKTLERPSNLAGTLHETAHPLLAALHRPGESYRLVGVGYAALGPVEPAAQGDLFSSGGDLTLSRAAALARQEAAIAAIRLKFGDGAIGLGGAKGRGSPATRPGKDEE
ncbi:MAG: DNA polymerase IV [Alphaproteobacteria bacterium]|nr:DNA polymerase IV [Alphaproteobacteria bacterium]